MSTSKVKFLSIVKSPMIQLLVLQVIALLLYPLSFLDQAPQAAVLPPTLLLLMIVAVVTSITGGLSLEAGRASLIFIQGVNIVVRMIIFFPNLKTPAGNWSWSLLIMQVIGIGLSWYTMVAIEKRPLRELNIIQTLKSEN